MAKQNLPSLSHSTQTNRIPISGTTRASAKSGQWGVSFQFFNQLDYFGLGEMDTKWFVSVLERLKDLNGIDLHEFITSTPMRSNNRYHPIDWNHTNTPLKRTDFSWVRKEIIDNEDDFPFYQFQISKALGRVIGFWNSSHNLFHVVLLDPAHNMQPSGGKYKYKVDKTSELSCEYTDMAKGLSHIIHEYGNQPEFSDIIKKLKLVPKEFVQRSVLFISVDGSYIEELNNKIGDRCISEVIELGILNLDNA